MGNGPHALGTTSVIVLVAIRLLIGLGMCSCRHPCCAVGGLIVPVIIANCCLRIPPWETGASRAAIVAAMLGIAEPALVLIFILAATMRTSPRPDALPGAGCVWMLGGRRWVAAGPSGCCGAGGGSGQRRQDGQEG